MKHSELIKAIREKLETEMAEKVRSVQILPHEAKVSLHAGFPIIGILDGGDKAPGPGKMQEQVKYHVYLVAYQQILSGDPGDAVVGTAAKPGVMNLVEEATGILEEERFGYFDYVKKMGSSPTGPYLEKEKKEIAFKVFRLEYRKLKTIGE